MGELISFLIIIFAIYALLSKRNQRRNNMSDTGKSPVAKPVAKTVQQRSATYYKVPQKRNDGSGHVHKGNSLTSVNALMDDRENDWLANQLRDEHKAFKQTSAMFDLKIEHVSHCDSRLLSTYHHINCDASGIDTGTPKKK